MDLLKFVVKCLKIPREKSTISPDLKRIMRRSFEKNRHLYFHGHTNGLYFHPMYNPMVYFENMRYYSD